MYTLDMGLSEPSLGTKQWITLLRIRLTFKFVCLLFLLQLKICRSESNCCYCWTEMIIITQSLTELYMMFLHQHLTDTLSYVDDSE